MSAPFYNSDSSLTKYALSCGYIQSKQVGDKRVELYHEHNCYHIRAFNYNLSDCRLVWESTGSLTYARKQYKSLKRLLGLSDGSTTARMERALSEL